MHHKGLTIAQACSTIWNSCCNWSYDLGIRVKICWEIVMWIIAVSTTIDNDVWPRRMVESCCEPSWIKHLWASPMTVCVKSVWCGPWVLHTHVSWFLYNCTTKYDLAYMTNWAYASGLDISIAKTQVCSIFREQWSEVPLISKKFPSFEWTRADEEPENILKQNEYEAPIIEFNSIYTGISRQTLPPEKNQ